MLLLHKNRCNVMFYILLCLLCVRHTLLINVLTVDLLTFVYYVITYFGVHMLIV